jgi:hypothetical protein
MVPLPLITEDTMVVLMVTVTVCVQVCVLPLASVTVHVTVVTPAGYWLLPGALLVTTSGPGQLSETVGAVSITVAKHWLALLPTDTFGAQVIVGFWLSFTVTVKLHVALLPAASITFQVTVDTPLLNTTPARVLEPLPVVAPVIV